jgi:hypothetical protein
MSKHLVGLAVIIVAAGAAASDAPFFYDPPPRWTEDPETEQVCEAVAAECAGLLKDGEINASWGYVELYDPAGFLVGIRTVKSTGCRPLDDHAMLGHRHFRAAFSKDGVPDLDDIRVELAPGVSQDKVRLLKQGETQIGIGC